jgi:aspartyl-tRNA(Asn)/glutamyl-tRNA(Gln) amidotransferase subunit A
VIGAFPSASQIARAVAAGEISAKESVLGALERIAARNLAVNAFTDVTAERALASAARIDGQRAAGRPPGPLAGVPFAVKNMIDIAGLPTRAGSRINRTQPPATRDAALVRRLEAADAVLLGGLNMGEYAYDFTGENSHDGPSRNPHDLAHMSGGSSGGCGAAVAAGLVPLALGSDTNGSIRVPSAMCGIFGLKPTFGRLSRAGSFPFVASLDHLGPLARSVADLALAYDAMQGPDADDPVATTRPPDPAAPSLESGIGGLRIAVAGDYFCQGARPEAMLAVEQVAQALGARRGLPWPEAARARAAAQLITAAEGAALHIDRLRTRSADFDPIVRDRLLAGAAVPATWVERAQRFRRWYQAEVRRLFETVDVVLAPALPFRAPRIGQTVLELDGRSVPVRASIGIYTQPLSFIGLPVVAVPVWIDAGLPLGVQLVAAPWREDLALRAAFHLERLGIARAPVAAL